MRHLTSQEIRKIAAAILRKHALAGATLTVADKGGGVNLGNLNATFSATQKAPTPMGGLPEVPKGDSNVPKK